MVRLVQPPLPFVEKFHTSGLVNGRRDSYNCLIAYLRKSVYRIPWPHRPLFALSVSGYLLPSRRQINS